jgi:hypothetical protein
MLVGQPIGIENIDGVAKQLFSSDAIQTSRPDFQCHYDGKYRWPVMKFWHLKFAHLGVNTLNRCIRSHVIERKEVI